MKQKSKEEIFSQLVDSINQWLTDCLFLSSAFIKGKYQIEGIKDEVWRLVESYAEIARTKYGKERDLESERTAGEITLILNRAMEDLIRKSIHENFFIVDLSLHKTEIVEKLNYIR